MIDWSVDFWACSKTGYPCTCSINACCLGVSLTVSSGGVADAGGAGQDVDANMILDTWIPLTTSLLCQTLPRIVFGLEQRGFHKLLLDSLECLLKTGKKRWYSNVNCLRAF